MRFFTEAQEVFTANGGYGLLNLPVKMEEVNKRTAQILKYAFSVHTELGPGLLESSYKECLF